MNLFMLLEHVARRSPSRGAVFYGNQCVQSYAELHERALRLAGGLAERGFRGSRIVIASENCVRYVELLFGIWAAEAVAVPLNAKLHPKEMVQIIDDADAGLIFASPKLAEGLRTALEENEIRGAEIVEIGSDDYALHFCDPVAAPVDTPADMLAWLFYTSGTTGRSKGAMLTHRNLMAMTLAHLADVDDIAEGDSQVHAAPMSHGSGLYIPAYVSRGARQVVPASGGFDPGEFTALCSSHPRCGSFLAPTMVQRLRLHAEHTGSKPTQLRTIVYGGGPMYVEELRKSQAVFGPVFVQIYGQGESPMTITWLSREDHAQSDTRVLGSVGQVRTGMAVRIVSDSGQDVARGETGEILCRGDTVMQGYWNNPAATTETLAHGWLRTGDMGSLDARGYLTLRDRSKDVIISGGSNIYPREVEEVLLQCPGVSEVSVVGQPDLDWGEIVIAFVVTTHEIDEEILDAHCLAHIARFKRPKVYRFIEQLPKNSYGKVLKRELRALLKGGG